MRLLLIGPSNPVAELAATTSLYAPQWPGIKCPRTIFISLYVVADGLTWRSCGGRERRNETGGWFLHLYGAIGRRQGDLYLARAVVPPPRLRAKSVLISAPLQPLPDSARWASPERARAKKTLQNPAPIPCFMSAQERCLKVLFSGDPRETSNLGMEGYGISWSPRAMRF